VAAQRRVEHAITFGLVHDNIDAIRQHYDAADADDDTTDEKKQRAPRVEQYTQELDIASASELLKLHSLLYDAACVDVAAAGLSPESVKK
jgi:hypothetical protein